MGNDGFFLLWPSIYLWAWGLYSNLLEDQDSGYCDGQFKLVPTRLANPANFANIVSLEIAPLTNIMKSLIAFVLLCTLASTSFGQTYWQQKVEYLMHIDFNVDTHQFSGVQSIDYYNHSPDTLYQVFYHLYFNAFQPGSVMDARSRNISDPDPRVSNRIAALQANEMGYQKVKSLKQDGQEATFKTVGTILEVSLPQAILPGAQTKLDMVFEAQVPIQIRRSGRDNQEGISYSMAQWYPKLAEYDRFGWHPNPYVGREFYGVWGDYDVKIKINKEYMIAATGYLQNPQDIGHGYTDQEVKQVTDEKKRLTWHFKAENVHDFVWAADPDYIHTIAQVPNGPAIHFFYQKGKATKAWEQLPEYTVKTFQYMNEHFGVYPYKKYSVIQGGDGGMEYPMATLLNGTGSFNGLLGTTVHELIHSWFQSVLATNESLHAWMDEGFTSYASNEVMDFLLNRTKKDQPGSYNGYFRLVESGMEEPLSTHADHFNSNFAYGLASYVKGSVFLTQLSYIIGKEHFDKGMKRYFETWKFKHPDPHDFIRIMEMESGIVLDWYLEYWIYSTKTIDYGIQKVFDSADVTYITLERFGNMIMPVDLEIMDHQGNLKAFYIPLEIMRGEKPNEYPGVEWHVAPDWSWTNPTYTLAIPGSTNGIKSITIDPSKRMADIKRENNHLEMATYQQSIPQK